MRIRLVCIFIYLLQTSYSLFAQSPQPSYTNFDVNDGLPSSEVYSGISDRNGYLWFATDRGLVKYNGYEFKVYTRKEGLTNNVVFDLFEDFKGRIWILPIDGRICYIDNGEITTYKFNHKLEPFLRTRRYFHSFYVDKDESVYVGTIDNGLIRITADGRVKRLDELEIKGSEFVKYDNRLLTYSNRVLNAPEFEFTHDGRSLSKDVSGPIRIKAYLMGEGMIGYNENGRVMLYDVDSKKLVDSIVYKNQITSFSQIDKLIFVGTELGGLKVYSIRDAKFIEVLSTLEKYTVGYPVKDKDGGYWIPTTQHGIFYTPNLNVRSYMEDQGLERSHVKQLGVFHDELMVGFGDRMQILNEDDLSLDVIDLLVPYGSKPNLLDLLFYDNCLLYGGRRKLIDICTQRIYPYIPPHLQIINDTTYLFSKSTAHFYTDGKLQGINGINNSHLPRIDDVIILGDQSYWVGTLEGLYKVTKTETVKMSKINPLFSYRAVDLAETDNYGIVIGTRGAGVLLYKDKKVTQISLQEGLISDDITNLHVDREQHIWVATSNGLHKIDAQDPKNIEYYSTHDGLISNEITSVKRIGDIVYVGTKRGLSMIDLRKFQKRNSSVPLLITNLALNGTDLEIGAQIEVFPEDKYLEISYLGLNYQAQGNIEYRYKIIGFSDEWQYTKDRQLKLVTFPERGTFTIEIYAREGHYGTWSAKPGIVIVNFHPPFYKTWTFRLSLLGLIVVLIYLAFKVDLLAYNKHIQQEIANRILKSMRKKTYLMIEVKQKKIRIDEAKILYVQSFKDYVEIVTQEKKYVYRSTMKNMEETLAANQFIRVHRSFIVRKDKIDSISTDKITIQQQEISIGKTYRSLLEEIRNQFSRLNK